MSQDIQTVENLLNLNEAMGNLDGDVELLQEILEIFLEMVPEQLEELDAHIQARRISDVDLLAHSLKGSASNFCAVKFVASSRKLEKLAKAGSLNGAEDMARQIRSDFAELQELQVGLDWDEVIRQWSS